MYALVTSHTSLNAATGSITTMNALPNVMELHPALKELVTRLKPVKSPWNGIQFAVMELPTETPVLLHAVWIMMKPLFWSVTTGNVLNVRVQCIWIPNVVVT